ncbi:TKL protein kinase [Saprolegnia parasitica CBS 223.65]|uniref:TKL protein kinase n=1 Tax=Saprolegnia parasitica (strain CBS 223.65) TaxID=695850 RepID=A0A067C3S1_SAPPC|nr:TKL protein kinase [Saprolegnia parasitica CBS 223.65]KDO25158.1 TKL protein kinase [Saprolegnia parasitica CBS 223.65]|eukprot:XP_012204226.1 TKL protein kinase [Saprolegnia parasitica CBS 223.65]
MTSRRRSLPNNNLTEIIGQDWTSMSLLVLFENPLHTFAFVELSSAFTFFNCEQCNLTNLTVSHSTFDVLKQLPQWNGGDEKFYGYTMDHSVHPDAVACNALNGSIKMLWKTFTETINACVIPDAVAPSPPTDANADFRLGMYCGIGATLGVLLVVLGGVLLWHRHRSASLHDVEHTQDTATDAHMPSQPRRRRPRRAFREREVGPELDIAALRPYKLALHDLTTVSQQPLGAGSFGEVWLGRYKTQLVAIKRVTSKSKKHVASFIDEIKLVASLDHDCIVAFVGASWRRPIDVECVIEYMDEGDLRSYLGKHSSAVFTWDAKLDSIASVVKGLVYLHSGDPPIIHRDLKSRNVLLDAVKGTKLTDFGVARGCDDDDDVMTNCIGTYQWMAPEIILGTFYNTSADVYSFGVLLSEYSTHDVPYANMVHPASQAPYSLQNILSLVATGSLRPRFETTEMPRWLLKLALACMEGAPEDRPSMREIHNVFVEVQQTGQPPPSLRVHYPLV